MSYKKKLRMRWCYTAVGLIISGLAMIGLVYFAKNEILSSIGFALVAAGLARIAKYRRVTRNEEVLRKYEIAETDERNVKIWMQSRSLASSLYIIITSVALLILYSIDMKREANILAINIFGFVAIYWIAYFIVKKRY